MCSTTRRFWKPIDRLRYAHYWDDEFAALNAALAGRSPTLLGEADFKRFRHMRDFAHHVSDILALFADTVQPRNFDEFVAYGFDDPVRGPGDEIKMRPPREIARGEANRPPAPPVDVARIDKYAPAELIGREAETAVIEQAWAKACNGEPHPFVLTFVALGGEGKTSLAAKWANDLAARGWPGCEAAFAWSFYSQGTREQVGASSDLFLAEAIKFFGAEAIEGESGHEKGKRLAKIVGAKRALLILDGLEPLQYPPTSPLAGQLKDDGVLALLKGLAQRNAGLCLVDDALCDRQSEGLRARPRRSATSRR